MSKGKVTMSEQQPVTDIPGIDPDRQRVAQEYARLRYRLLALDLALSAAYVLLWLFSGLSVAVRERLATLSQWPLFVVAGYTIVFFAAYGLLLAPLGYYSGFVLPHRYGLSTQTRRGWIVDMVKSSALGGAMTLLVMEVLYALLRMAPETWWLYMAAFLLFVQVVLATLAPILIMPIFWKLRPLADEVLAERLENLARRAGQRVRGVFVMDMSTRTRAANAMLMGLFGTRRIVLGDTLLDQYTPDEIETILAHELAHHVHHDIGWSIVLDVFHTIIVLYLSHLTLRWGLARAGFAAPGDVAAFPILAAVLGGFSVLTTPLTNAYSRWRESLADGYALVMTGNANAFISSEVKLVNQNLAVLWPEAWVEALLYTHPAPGRRITRAMAFQREKEGTQ